MWPGSALEGFVQWGVKHVSCRDLICLCKVMFNPVMIKPAAEAGGQPAVGRGVASERRVAGSWPASGGVRAEPLPSEARDAPWRRRASLGPTAFFQ